MAITTMDGLVAGLANSSDQQLFLLSVTNAVGGIVWLNRATTGSFGLLADPAANTAGGTTYNQSSLTTGIPRWTADGAHNAYLGRVGMAMATVGTVHIYDMYWACVGFSGMVTTAQAVTGFSGMPARNTTGSGAEIWVWNKTATGATASNITVQYTNQSGTSARGTVSTAMITSMPANRMFQVPLQSGDTGVQSIQSVTLSASTDTAGSFGVLIANRLCSLAVPVANVGQSLDFASLSLPLIDDNSCINFFHQASTTSSGIIMGQMSIIHG